MTKHSLSAVAMNLSWERDKEHPLQHGTGKQEHTTLCKNTIKAELIKADEMLKSRVASSSKAWTCLDLKFSDHLGCMCCNFFVPTALFLPSQMSCATSLLFPEGPNTSGFWNYSGNVFATATIQTCNLKAWEHTRVRARSYTTLQCWYSHNADQRERINIPLPWGSLFDLPPSNARYSVHHIGVSTAKLNWLGTWSDFTMNEWASEEHSILFSEEEEPHTIPTIQGPFISCQLWHKLSSKFLILMWCNDFKPRKIC